MISEFWKPDLTPGDTGAEAERAAVIVAAVPALKILRLRIESNLKALEAQRESVDYTSPAWAYQQADLNGRIKVYKHILDKLKDL